MCDEELDAFLPSTPAGSGARGHVDAPAVGSMQSLLIKVWPGIEHRRPALNALHLGLVRIRPSAPSNPLSL
jgi:hypothetical protein